MTATLHSLTKRLRQLEASRNQGGKCGTCFDYPIRLVYADPDDGDRVWWESLPEDGCPECGRPIGQAVWIMLPDADNGEAPA